MDIYNKEQWERIAATADAVDGWTVELITKDNVDLNSSVALSGTPSGTTCQFVTCSYDPRYNRVHSMWITST